MTIELYAKHEIFRIVEIVCYERWALAHLAGLIN